VTLAETFLQEFDAEMAATRPLLARMPSEGLGWKPHGKSRSLGQLATHVTELARWGVRLESPTWTLGSDAPPSLTSAKDFVARFDENVAESRAAIAAKSDPQFLEKFVLLRDGKPFLEMPKAAVLRRIFMNHFIHHRGQLTVYMRLRDIALPPVYGPTADQAI
jgi:uncharacterized damage-inducible protein DinB